MATHYLLTRTVFDHRVVSVIRRPITQIILETRAHEQGKRGESFDAEV